ncbi:hypothetical protein M9H77_08715 [Catharanthus roseus]|uniref:Uncharacterized protein n=1 Tax=Catharanthus roseus TaxID=4058 RepID=A0ACC0BYM2_CATRO|nr:hypothetical protein M9H77_08715 [Catharanthus roseus]
MKVIMQDLQLMRNDMKEMRGNITNLSMEHRDQSNIREHTTSHTQWGYGNFSPEARTFEQNSMIATSAIDLELEVVVMIHLVKEFQGMNTNMSNNNDSYSYGKYNCRRCSQTLGTTSRPLSYNNLKLPLLCGTFGSYDYVAWEQEVESLFYSYGVREEEKFQLVLKSLFYGVNILWDCKCENRRRMGFQQIKICCIMKKVLRNRFGVGNHEGQRQGQAKEKFMESSVGEKATKVDELSQVQDRITTHNEKKTLMPL